MTPERATRVLRNTVTRELTEEWCMALHGNHDEHQCHKKPGHKSETGLDKLYHECYCEVRW